MLGAFSDSDQPMVGLLASAADRAVAGRSDRRRRRRYGLRRVHKNGHVPNCYSHSASPFAIEEIVQISGARVRWISACAAARFSGLHDLLHQLSRLQDVHVAGLGGDLRSVADHAQKTRIGLIVQAALTHPHM